MKRDHDNPQPVIEALAKAKRTSGWNNRRPDVQRFKLANVYGHEPCTLLIVPAVAFTRNAERARDERMHGRCLWWNQWARDVGWAIGKPTPQHVQERQHGDTRHDPQLRRTGARIPA